MDYHILIPARYNSSRLPGKPLLNIAGKPMIQRVYEQACLSTALSIKIATDSQQIMDVAKSFGAEVCMTSNEHKSGFERVAEVVNKSSYADEDIIVNIQGDEPLTPVTLVEQLVNNLIGHSNFNIATLCEPITQTKDISDPNQVKVVFNKFKQALYFSRSIIPHNRLQTTINYYRHIGLYAYRAKLFRNMADWSETDLETQESLEQLKFLWNGENIHIDIACESMPPGVNTEEDLKLVRSILVSQSKPF